MDSQNEPVSLEESPLQSTALHLHSLGGITQGAGVIVFLDLVRVANFQRRVQVALQLENTEIPAPVDAHHPLHRYPVAVAKNGFHRDRIDQHMIVRDQRAIGFHDKTGARPEGLPFVPLGDQQDDGILIDLVAQCDGRLEQEYGGQRQNPQTVPKTS